MLLNSVYFVDEVSRRWLQTDTDRKIDKVHDDMRRDLEARTNEYTDDIIFVVNDKTGNTLGIRLAEKLYKNLNAVTPFDGSPPASVQMVLAPALALPMVVAFARAMRGQDD